MFFVRLGLRGVLTAALSLFAFACILPAQYERPSRRLPAASSADRFSFTMGDCQSANLDSHLRSPMLTGTPHVPNCETPPADTADLSPCSGRSGHRPSCNNAGDSAAQLALENLGKKGRSIFGARARVLEILEADSACTAWFRDRAPDPARLFRTLSFTVDSKAIDYVMQRRDSGGAGVFANPYVATVVQDGGEFQNVALNAGGAFFRPSATLVRLSKEGGPLQFHGARMLKVGPYMGNTLQAQITTLLHELGHVAGLLPLDTNDVNGQSAANTREVLRHCQPEIESTAKHRWLSASQ
jgi:hypothetical protein